MPTTRQWVLYGGIGAGGLALAAYMYERNKKQKAATAAAAATTSQQYAYGAYAYGYGEQAYGYGQLTYQPEVYGYGLGYYGYGLSYPYGSAGGTGTVPVAAATTNAMWAQAAVSQLTNQGYTGTDVQAALGVYLTGGTLSGTQQSIVQAAIGVEGYPPQNGPDGYPPAMHSATVNAPPPTGGGGATTVQVPYVVGQRLDVAIKNIENAGLKEHTTTLAAYGFPSRWKVAGQNPAGGQVPRGSTVTCSAVKA